MDEINEKVARLATAVEDIAITTTTAKVLATITKEEEVKESASKIVTLKKSKSPFGSPRSGSPNADPTSTADNKPFKRSSSCSSISSFVMVDTPIGSDSRNSDTEKEMNASPSTTTSPPEADKKVHYGKCKWFNVVKGWGFITPNDGGPDVFVHQSVIQMSGYRSLGEQEDVEYEVGLTWQGLAATRVSGRNGADCAGGKKFTKKKRQRRSLCYNCRKPADHLAVDCTLEPQPKVCYYCKKDDHLVADCAEKKVRHKEEDKETYVKEGIGQSEDNTDKSCIIA